MVASRKVLCLFAVVILVLLGIFFAAERIYPRTEGQAKLNAQLSAFRSIGLVLQVKGDVDKQVPTFDSADMPGWARQDRELEKLVGVEGTDRFRDALRAVHKFGWHFKTNPAIEGQPFRSVTQSDILLMRVDPDPSGWRRMTVDGTLSR